MVALHNRKLNEKDLFPGVLWTDKEWFAVKDKFFEELVAEGVEHPALQFRLSRMMENYQQAQPSMRERQKIMARIYPPQKISESGPFTPEELEWLLARLDGVNDPVGQGVVEKLRKFKP
jgi:hypothetical protein